VFHHPLRERIDAYTAWRYGCPTSLLRSQGVHVLSALAPPDANLLVSTAARQPDVISVTRMSADVTIVRAHPTPDAGVRRLLEEVESRGYFAADVADAIPGVSLTQEEVEPYLYLDAAHFRPYLAGEIRRLAASDALAMEALHARIPAGMRWFVELDHPVVFGCFVEGELAAVASHFLFEEQGIAAGGVLTVPAYRGQGLGKAVVSATMAWALAEGYICEWSTWEANTASYRLAKALGFEDYLREEEYRVSNGLASANSAQRS
jgi:RimJ/RimL family protein N-acetyltransferase